MASVRIEGNTYPVKDALKALGARWDADSKAWMVPAEKADQARALVTGAPAGQSAYRPRTCSVCRQREEADYGSKIMRSGVCRDCSQERRMGY
jgi:hypothetical protein